MRRFIWKVLSIMLLVSALPLLSGVFIVESMLKDSIALGLDARVGRTLKSSGDVYTDHINFHKRIMALQTSEFAGRPALADALRAGDAEGLQTYLRGAIKTLDNGPQRVSKIAIRSLQPADRDLDVEVSSLDAFPAKEWRPKIRRTNFDVDGQPFEVQVTYVVPWSLFQNFEEMKEVSKIYQALGERQASLVEGYTRTFYATAGIVLLITFGLGVLLALSTTRRLKRLADATSLVGAGNLDVQVPVTGVDEIAQLTADFNRMIVELSQARSRLTYLERVSTWQEIARRLAHEIKNPLTPILLAVQQLDRKFDAYHDRPERYRKLVSASMEIVSEEVDSLRRLVQEFSEFARLPRVQPKATDAVRFVADVLRTNPQFDAFLVKTRAAPPCSALIDATMMRRVLINLVENASQAVQAAGETPKDSVQVSVVQHDARFVALEVLDRGVGVPEENIARLFDPYFTTKQDGTGLGLAIVKKVVIDHGGDISVGPRPDGTRGTLIRVLLPVP